MKALVEAGANVSLAADGGVTPLHAAAELGVLDLVNVLLKVLSFDHTALCFRLCVAFAFKCISVLVLKFSPLYAFACLFP